MQVLSFRMLNNERNISASAVCRPQRASCINSFSLMTSTSLSRAITAWRSHFWSENYDKYTLCTVHRCLTCYTEKGRTANSGRRDKDTGIPECTTGVIVFSCDDLEGFPLRVRRTSVTRTSGDDDNATVRRVSHNRQTRSFPRFARFVGSAHTHKGLSNSERDEINRLPSLSHSLGFAIRHLLQKFTDWFTAVRLARYPRWYVSLFFSMYNERSGETGRMYRIQMIYFLYKIVHSPSPAGSHPRRSSPHVSRTRRSGSKNGKRAD